MQNSYIDSDFLGDQLCIQGQLPYLGEKLRTYTNLAMQSQIYAGLISCSCLLASIKTEKQVRMDVISS